MTASPIRYCLFGFLLWTLAGAAWAQGFNEGMRAYDAGNFAKALEIWGPLAEDFDVVVFDFRNHGRNPRSDPANHHYAQMAREMVQSGDLLDN